MVARPRSRRAADRRRPPPASHPSRCGRRRSRGSASTARRAGPSCAPRSGATSPVAASERRASPTSRVPAGSSWAVGSSRITWRGRIARSEAIPTSCDWPPESRVGSRRMIASSRRSAMAWRVRSTVSATSSPRFIGPSAISSKTVAAIPERWVFGFWKPTTTRSASWWVDSPAVGCPSIVSAPRRDAADRRGRQPGRDQAERRLARLVRPDQPDDLAVVEAEVDVVEDLVLVAGVAIGDPGQLQHRRLRRSSGRCR